MAGEGGEERTMLLRSELAPKFSLVVRDCTGWDLGSLSEARFLMCLRFGFTLAEISRKVAALSWHRSLLAHKQMDAGHQRGPCMGCSEGSFGGKGVMRPGTHLEKSQGLFTSAQPLLKCENTHVQVKCRSQKQAGCDTDASLARVMRGVLC